MDTLNTSIKPENLKFLIEQSLKQHNIDKNLEQSPSHFEMNLFPNLTSSPDQQQSAAAAAFYCKSEPIFINNPLVQQSSSDSSSFEFSPQGVSNKITSTHEDYLDSSIYYDEHESANQQSSLNRSIGRGNRFFPDNVVDILNKWFFDNQDYPYPDEAMTNVLAKEANISAKQVRKWFANKRVRSNKCYKQTFRAKKDEPKRRQTKSISDIEISSSTFDAELKRNKRMGNNITTTANDNNCGGGSGAQQVCGSLSSSVSSSSSFTSSNSPTYSSTYPSSPLQQISEPSEYNNTSSSSSSSSSSSNLNNSQQVQEILYNIWKNNNNQSAQLNQQAEPNASLLCSTQNSGSTVSALLAAASALYNPYLFNFVNNPNLALHAAALTNRLMLLKSSSESSTAQKMTAGECQIGEQSQPDSPFYIKRKTHLSNCFLNDLTQKLNEPSSIQQQQQSAYDFNSSSLRSSFSCSSLSSPQQYEPDSPVFSAQDKKSFYAEQTMNAQENRQPVSKRTKINFRDISDLIN